MGLGGLNLGWGGFKIGFENAKMGLRVLWGSQNEAEEGI